MRKHLVISGAFSTLFLLALLIFLALRYDIRISYESGPIRAETGTFGLAIHNYSIDRIEALISVYPSTLNEIYAGGMTPLGEAVNARHPEVVRLLINRGADPNFPREYTPLHRAIGWGYPEVVEQLLIGGADLTIQYEGMTAIERAERAGRSEVTEIIRKFSDKTSSLSHDY